MPLWNRYVATLDLSALLTQESNSICKTFASKAAKSGSLRCLSNVITLPLQPLIVQSFQVLDESAKMPNNESRFQFLEANKLYMLDSMEVYMLTFHGVRNRETLSSS